MTATLEAPTVPTTPEPHRQKPRPWGKIFALVIAVVVALIVVVPLAYVIIGGFRTSGQISNKPFGMPNPWVWANYSTILSTGAFWQEVWNSVFIAVVTTLLVVWLGSMAAFALSRYAFRGRESIYTFFTLGPAVPRGRGDPAAVRPAPGHQLAEHTVGGRLPAGGVRAADHHRHPAAVHARGPG